MTAPLAAESAARPTPRALFMAQMNASRFTAEFLAFLPGNLHVWDAFEREALAVIAAGIQHYSARTIVHVLRHHSAISQTSGMWKINDHTSPYFGRLFDLMHPEHVGLFEFRTTKPNRARLGPVAHEKVAPPLVPFSTDRYRGYLVPGEASVQ